MSGDSDLEAVDSLSESNNPSPITKQNAVFVVTVGLVKRPLGHFLILQYQFARILEQPRRNVISFPCCELDGSNEIPVV